MSTRSRWKRVIHIAGAFALLTNLLATTASGSPLGGANDTTLAREPQLTPAAIGDGSTAGLQFADPTEGLALVQPPEASNDGGAHLSYPLLIPKGRGIAPDLSLQYDSGGGNGWAGLGWDLSVGEISVDTRWGAPRFDPNKESETYLLDGDMLIPNSLGTAWAPRVHGDRQDYTRQVETEYQQIIRHEVPGEGPAGYFWEVHDKGGNVFWYGGKPDQGGPDGYGLLGDPNSTLTPEIDRSAIITDENGNGVRWLLSAQRDVGVNQISYHYTTIQYQYGANGWVAQASCTPSASVLCAKHTYLSSINYTEAATVAPAPDGDAEYQVVLQRESQIHPDSPVRADPVVDAKGGFIDLTTDLLARVEVRHGSYTVLPDPDPDGNEQRTDRVYDQLAVRYDLGYTTGPFGKSLLSTVTQVGSDQTTSATHTFTYYDRVSDGSDGYNGFAAPTDWDTGSDLPDRLLLDSSAAIGALGSSESNSGEGHAYIGFNPAIPEKVGSFGGSLQIGGGATEAIAEWLDINGDGLPDKVYRDSDGTGGDLNDVNRNGPIRYRLNRGGPNGSVTFSDEMTVTGITRLSTEGNFGLEGAFEAFPGATVAFGIGAEVSWGDAYFSDVNADGLPDYVTGGQVWFNHLDSAGTPIFEQGSGNTQVPIEDATASTSLPPSVQDIQARLQAQNPLVDTVRRWTAPFAGTVSLDASVTLSQTGGSSLDGVRVAIQQNGTELAAANLLGPGSQAFTSPIVRTVAQGDMFYFRVGSVNDGANDEVIWSPTITYSAIDGVADITTVLTDVNGLSQTNYVASDDFVLSGRPDTMVFMPFQGTVHFSATVDKQKVTSDDVRVVLLHNGLPVSVADATFSAAFQGSRTVTADFDVAAPVQPPDPSVQGSQDSVTVKLVTDTQIDLTAIAWNPMIAYTTAFDKDGNPKDLVRGPISLNMTPEIEQYPHSSATGVSVPWSTGSAITRDAEVTFSEAAGNPGGAAVVAVKTRSGVIARGTVNLPPAPVGAIVTADVPLNAAIQANTDYWFDVTIRDPALSDKTALAGFKLVNGTPADDISVPATLYWTGRQGIFPLPYRGWAVAGYNGDGDRATQPIHEDDFVIDPSTLPTATQVPTGFNDPDYNPPTEDKSYAYLPAVQSISIPGQPAPITSIAWVGNRANLAASADRQVSSRLGADTINLSTGDIGGSGRAVNRISITAPSAKLAFGVGPLGASFGVGPSFGLVDYMDMNGDGYPDIVTPNSVTYTTPRGGYDSSSMDPGDLAVTNQDLTLSLSAGFESGLVDIKGNAKGKANATQGSGAAKGSDGADSGGGAGFGAGFDVSWTSPNASGPSDEPIAGGVSGDPSVTYSEQISKTTEVDGLPGETAPIQLGLADVNGDGLPDRVFTTPSGVFARYNLGYRFAAAPVKLSTGGFEAQESYAGGLSLGFSTPWQDFSGGAALNWNVDLSRYAWIDVNGDGILDQVHKIDNSHPPTVRFGTGTDMLPPVTYGQMADARITDQIDAGQQASLDRTNGLGGQFDFTVGIGPLCLVACYLIINPGASYQNSISSTEIDLQDVNGDGYADSVQTLDDDTISVRENNQADTNLLSMVQNPLGGTMSITYQRDGNTVDNPSSVWDMASVAVNDGRTGDGVDVRLTDYTYEGLKASRMHRDTLGYATVTETEMDTAVDPPTPLRATVHQYLNGNVFEAGLETSTMVLDPSNGGYIKGVRQTWVLRDVRSAGADLNALESVPSLGYSLAPMLTSVVTEVGDGTPNGVGQSSTTNLTYDDLGDVVRQADLGEDDDPNDDAVADYSYSRCADSSTIGCAGDLPHDNPSPIWNAGLCPTWVSLPVVITITNGKTGADLKVYRQRDGSPAICDNASVTHLEEELGNGQVASTELTYDAWGSYDRVVYPVGGNGQRYSVQYVWDPDGHATIGQVTEYDLDPAAVDDFLGDGLQPGDVYTQGLTSSATFDPLTNRVASRTDANGNVTHYTYDALARQASISSPVPSDPQALVTYEYFLSTPAAPTAHAVAHHFDVFHPNDPIDTATFVDGTGRVVQTQNDASLFRGAGQTAETGVIVSGGTIFDALGRPLAQYNPTKSTKPFGVFEDSAPFDLVNDPHTTTVYDLWDSPDVITDPGNRETNIAYDYGQINGAGPQLFMTTETAPNGRATVTYADMRDVVRAVKDVPVGAPAQQTLYDNDGMGQLLKVTDPTGFFTTNTYDEMGRRTSTNTPDGGLVTFGYDADGQQVSQVTPNLRAQNQQISYQYQLHRLTRIDYPGASDDVTYTYGDMGAPDNGAGQVVRLEDSSQIEQNKYDPAGNVVSQTVTMKLHAWTPGGDQSRFTWTTQWQYDGLGRLKSMVYPDSERLTYGYDAGGLVNFVAGDEDGFKTIIIGYDEYGQPIYQQIPWTWHYSYLNDRQYDVFLHRRYDVDGNGVTTELTFDADTQWLTRQQTISPNRDLKNQSAAYEEIQDLSYTYDSVGNPQTYRNDVPAPVPNLFSGPTSETYTYDPYGRVVAATGQFQLAPDELQHFSQSLTFDARGNVTAKNQLDQILHKNKDRTQSETTYSYSRTYSPSRPHQVATDGTDSYAYDADGNLLAIRDRKGHLVRAMTWDANDRMRNVSDASSSTDYTYDDTGQRAIERGPGGETATLNPWATVRNTTDMYKYVWAGNDRIAEQRDNGGNEEMQRYFLHKDLQGSTNIVTDPLGNTFQHQEYFPGGEVWFADNSTVFRTPFQYGGGYVDEVRALYNFGDRWYDPIRELMYSPDPVLVDDPAAIVTTPSLRAAYAFAGSNAVTNIDPSGQQFTPAQRKAFIKANFKQARAIVAQDPALRASLEANLKTRLPKSLVRLGLDIESADLHQKRFNMIDDIAKPFVEINISTGEVQLSPGLFKQFTVRKGKGATGNAATQSSGGSQAGATNASGGPSASTAKPAAGSGSGSVGPSPSKKAPPRPLSQPPHGANTVKGNT
jgi:RHS repeat-associated protein